LVPNSSAIFEFSVLHAGCGCALSPEKTSISVCDAIRSDLPTWWLLRLKHDDDAGAADNGDYYEERSWHTEATVGDIFQGDLAIKTQSNAQDIQIAGIVVVQPRV
jgi:hypothetical protein